MILNNYSRVIPVAGSHITITFRVGTREGTHYTCVASFISRQRAQCINRRLSLPRMAILEKIEEKKKRHYSLTFTPLNRVIPEIKPVVSRQFDKAQ
jgi:hypothetical protein